MRHFFREQKRQRTIRTPLNEIDLAFSAVPSCMA